MAGRLRSHRQTRNPLNILLVTSNYPKYEGQPRGKSTFALHDMVLEWTKAGDRVVVLRVQDTSLLRLLGIGRKLRVRGIDGVKVVFVPLVRLYAIEDRSRNPVKLRLLALLSRRLYRPNRYARFLQKLSFAPDVILGHLGEGFILASRLKDVYRVPLVYGVHESDVLYPERTADYLPRADAIAFRSPALERRFPPVPEQLPTFYALSGIEEEAIRTLPEVQPKWSSTARRLLTVCRLGKKKNTDVTLKALALVKDIDNWSFDIIGRGPERPHLEQLVESLGLQERVRFLGYKTRRECLEEMRHSHLYVMPSEPETFGLVYLEALSQGMIVIGSRGWGLDGILEFGESGYFARPGDHVELGEILRRVLTTPQDNVLARSMEIIKTLTRQRTAAAYREKLLALKEIHSV